MKEDIKKVDNIDSYKNSFNIIHFIESIKLTPTPWHQGRVGKDDYWGVNLSLSWNYDPYFIMNKIVHRSGVDFKLWEDSGYCSGYSVVSELKQSGMVDEWAEATKREKSLKDYISSIYNKDEHCNVLEIINTLDEEELATLNSIYFYLDYPSDHRLMLYKNKGTLINKVRSQLSNNLDLRGLKSLVKKNTISFNFKLEILDGDKPEVYTLDEWQKII